MDDYYGHQPLATLDRHLVLVGYVGEETRRIGFQLASRTGLSVCDVDRTVEHRTGMSIWELVSTEGEFRYRVVEREVLESLLRANPPCIVSLGDGTLLDPENWKLVKSQADVVLLDRDLSHCYWRLQHRTPAYPGAWHPSSLEPLTSIDQIRGYYDARRRCFSEIGDRIDLRGRSSRRVVDELIGRLD